METPRSPFNITSDSHLYSTTFKPNDSAHNKSTNKENYIDVIRNGETVYISIISCLEIPAICLAIYAVYFLIKSKQAAPVFVINLLISDLIQIVCMLLLNVLKFQIDVILLLTWAWAGFTGPYFMTCIAVERYILIAHPIWHRTHHSVKCFVCTSLIGWLIPSIVLIDLEWVTIIFFIYYLVIVLCFIGSFRSLSHSVSITPLKKQLVLGPLFFVVMSYTFLILPFAISFVCSHILPLNLFFFSLYIYLLNPLVDCLLYVFMRSDAENIIRMPLCCSRLKRDRTETGQTTFTDIQSDRVRDSHQTADVSN